MKSLATSLCLSILLLITAPVAAQGILYAANGGSGGGASNAGAILTVNPQTAAATVVGTPTDPMDPEGLPGIDFDSTGRMFAVTGEGGALGAPYLLEVDPTDGSLVENVGLLLEGGTEIGIADVSYQPGSNTLFGIVAYGGDVAGSGWLVTIDTTSGEVTPIGDTGLGDWGGIAFASDGTLYHVTFYDGLTEELHTLDPSTGAVLTTTPLSRFYMSLAVRPSDGMLFATQRPGAGGANFGDLYTIDPDTGTETFVGATGNGIHDLAFLDETQPPEAAIPMVGLAGIVALVLIFAVAGVLRLRS